MCWQASVCLKNNSNGHRQILIRFSREAGNGPREKKLVDERPIWIHVGIQESLKIRYREETVMAPRLHQMVLSVARAAILTKNGEKTRPERQQQKVQCRTVWSCQSCERESTIIK